VDLIAGKLRLRPLARNDDGPACRVNFPGMLEGNFQGHKEQHLQHFNHIVIGVFVVIQQNDMKKTVVLFPFVLTKGRRNRGSNGALHRENAFLLKHPEATTRKGRSVWRLSCIQLLLE
jgi:hypothetical protein